MIKELDTVVLAKDLQEYNLKSGDVGTVMHIYEGGKAYEVEFITDDGKTIAVTTLSQNEIYPTQRNQ